jgi:hypothetical protein
MKTCFKKLALGACLLALTATVYADESVAGLWKAQFDSQIGVQKYTYVFKVDGTNVTGTATGARQMGTNTVAITDGKINGDEISFVEPLTFQDQELQIKYDGKVSGDEIKFTRHVGDFATEELVAHRVKGAAATSGVKPEVQTETNSPAAKP